MDKMSVEEIAPLESGAVQLAGTLPSITVKKGKKQVDALRDTFKATNAVEHSLTAVWYVQGDTPGLTKVTRVPKPDK
jgi:hypothetical protein